MSYPNRVSTDATGRLDLLDAQVAALESQQVADEAASGAPVVLTSDAAPAITSLSGVVFLNKETAGAWTLAAPTAGDDDGKVLRFVDVAGVANTVTTEADVINGSKHVVTFSGTAGSFVELVAYNEVWYTQSANGVAIS